MQFDDLLAQAGDFHRFQWILLTFLCVPFCFFVTFVYFGQIFTSLEPDHWCKVPALIDAGFSPSLRRNLTAPMEIDNHGTLAFSRCKMYNLDYQGLIGNETSVIANWSSVIDKAGVVGCKFGWDYDLSEMYSTAVSEWDWVCEDNWKSPLAQSVFFIGGVIGCFFFGFVSDRIGRVPVLILTNILGAAAGVATAFSSGFISYTLFRFFAGLSFDTCFMIYYILVLEYVSPARRSLVSCISIGIFFCVATSVIPWIALAIGNWRIFCLVTSAPLFITIFLWRLLPESARWLLSKGEVKEATKIIERIAKINGKTLKDATIQEFEESVKSESSENKSEEKVTLYHALRLPVLRRRILLLFCLWFLVSLVYDGHARNTHNFGLNLFWSFSLAAGTELPASILLIFLLDRVGRRWLFFSSLILSGIVSLASTAFSVGLPLAILALWGRFFISVAFNIGLQYAAELFPTSVRGQGMATTHVLGFVANIISPFVVYLANWNRSLPLLVLGGISILAGFVSLLLPETVKETLARTLKDGNEFAVDQPFFYFPCCSRKTNRSKKEVGIAYTNEAFSSEL